MYCECKLIAGLSLLQVMMQHAPNFIYMIIYNRHWLGLSLQKNGAMWLHEYSGFEWMSYMIYVSITVKCMSINKKTLTPQTINKLEYIYIENNMATEMSLTLEYWNYGSRDVSNIGDPGYKDAKPPRPSKCGEYLYYSVYVHTCHSKLQRSAHVARLVYIYIHLPEVKNLSL